MSRKKTPKSKGASATAASALPAANGPRPARPGPEAPRNGPPQPGRPSLGGGGDFYDFAFKVSRAPPLPPSPAPKRVQQVASGRNPAGRGSRERVQGPADSGHGADPSGTPQLARLAWCIARAHTHTQLSDPGLGYSTAGKACPLAPSWQGQTRGSGEVRAWQVSSPSSLVPPPPPVSVFPYAAFPHTQGLRVSSFFTGETSERIASRVGSTAASSRPRQNLVNWGGWQDHRGVSEPLAAGWGMGRSRGRPDPPCPQTWPDRS